MSNRKIDFYNQEGFLLIREFWNASEVERLIAAKNELESNKGYHSEFPHLYDYEPNQNKSVIRRIQNPDKIFPLFYNFASDKKILSLLRPILGVNIRLEGIKINFKSPMHGSAIEWHQDWAFHPYTNDDVLTIGIFLDSCKRENGAMQVLPRTHKSSIYAHTEVNGAFVGAINMQKDKVDVKDVVYIEGEPRDISLHHYRIIHGSAFNTTDQPRCILFFRYASADAWPLLGTMDFRNGFSFQALQDRIILGEQTFRPRLEKVPVRMPLPYPENWDTLYQVQETAQEKYFSVNSK